MRFPRSPQIGKCLRYGYILLAAVGLLFLSPLLPARGQEFSAGCSQPLGQCAYLPLVNRVADPRSRADALAMYRSWYLGSNTKTIGWTGWNFTNCIPGNISQAYRDAVLLRVNYYRSMAGVPPIMELGAEYNQQDQAAAFVMSANNQISYEPPSTWLCVQKNPAAVEGARYSLMTGSYHGPDAVEFYMDDTSEYPIDASTKTYLVGYRRYLLYPQTWTMGDGEVTATTGHMGVSALRVMDGHYYDPRPITRNTYVAWPPAAYVPYQVVPALWSFSYARADFTKATVSMTRGGEPVNITRYIPLNGWGENTLVWKAGEMGDWPKPGADQAYVVSIKNVLIGEKARSFSYTVVVFDPGG